MDEKECTKRYYGYLKRELKIRKELSKSGAIAVQIIRYHDNKHFIVQHIGSTPDFSDHSPLINQGGSSNGCIYKLPKALGKSPTTS
jgi:hypothetical protein